MPPGLLLYIAQPSFEEANDICRAEGHFGAQSTGRSLPLQRPYCTSLRLKLGANRFKLKIFPSKVSAKVLKGTKYENMAPLFSGPSVLAFSDSSPVLSDLLMVTTGEKKLLLLGGLMENQLFSSKGLEDYAKLPSLEVMHQELVGVLSHPQTMLSGLLQGSAARLSCMLEQISKADQTHP